VKYAVAIPSNGPVHIAWAIMYSQLQWPVSGERNTIVPIKVPIATARNNCAIAAKERDCKYLVFIDDDVLIPDSAMKLMLYQMEQNDDWDAITGVYCTKTIPPEPLIFGGKPEDVSGPYWDWKMGETFPVWGAGLGCCVIRVSAFDKIEEPYFAFVESSDGMNSEKEGASCMRQAARCFVTAQSFAAIWTARTIKFTRCGKTPSRTRTASPKWRIPWNAWCQTNLPRR
jgi:hypothetical protein